MKIAELMTRDVTLVRPTTPVQEIACLMRDEDLGAIPVAEDDRLVGMVTDRDIVVRGLVSGTSLDSIAARDVMSEGTVYYCFADQESEAVMDNMSELQIRRMPVVNRDKRLVGIVSLGDLAAANQPRRAGQTLQRISESAAA